MGKMEDGFHCSTFEGYGHVEFRGECKELTRQMEMEIS